MRGPDRYDPFDLGLHEPPRRAPYRHAPPARPSYPAPGPQAYGRGQDSTACGATAHTINPPPKPDVLGELRLLGGAAVLGLTLAIATAFTLRTASQSGEAAAAATPPDLQNAPAQPSTQEPEASADRPTLTTSLAAQASRCGAEADVLASEKAETIAEEREEARRRAAEAEAARAAEEAAALHAASGDGVINLDLEDEAEAEGTEPTEEEESDSATMSAKRRAFLEAVARRRAERRDARPSSKATSEREEPEPAPKEASTTKAAPAGPFDRDAARSAMFAASGSAAGCATPGGPSGRGKASVTLSPSGNVSSVSVGGAFAGTKTGRCVASVFRSVAVPPFTGGPVTLQKSFRIPASAKASSKSAAETDDAKQKRKKKRRRRRRR